MVEILVQKSQSTLNWDLVQNTPKIWNLDRTWDLSFDYPRIHPTQPTPWKLKFGQDLGLWVLTTPEYPLRMWRLISVSPVGTISLKQFYSSHKWSLKIVTLPYLIQESDTLLLVNTAICYALQKVFFRFIEALIASLPQCNGHFLL